MPEESAGRPTVSTPNQAKRKTQVVIVHPALAPYRIDLFNRLAQGMSLRVIFLGERVHYHPELDQGALRQHLKFDHLFLRGTGEHDSIGKSLLAEVRAHRPEVVVTHEFGIATLMLLRRSLWQVDRGAGLVIWSAENQHTLATRGWVRRSMRRLGCAHADALLVYSESARAEFAKRWMPENRIHLCANLQNEQAFRRCLRSAERHVEPLVDRHHLRGRRTVLYVGRLAAEKNLERLLVAFASLVRQHAEAVLVLVGSGPLLRKLQVMASDLQLLSRPNVIFLGHLQGEELLAWYRIATVAVLPSLSEPFGAVVNEALMAGVPVVCSSRCGASSLIRNGVSGQVVDPLDVEGLSRALAVWLLQGELRTVANGEYPGSLMTIKFARDVRGMHDAIEAARLRR